jgi:ribonuclease P protein component
MMKFSRQSRLLKPAEFKLVFQDPIRSGDEYFRVLARNNDVHRNRLGMAVSKKNCARAVDRNRIKRVLRESFRSQMAGMVVPDTMDFVVMPTNRAVKQNNNVLNESISAQWQRLTRKAGARNTGARQDQSRTPK